MKRGRRVIHILFAACTLQLISLSSSAALTDDKKADLFSRAKDAFAEGNSLRVKNSELSKQKYAIAGALFERIEREGKVRNGKLYYNIGNAYFLQNRIGPAILYYRRAEALMPRHTDLRRNLSTVRASRKDYVEIPTKKKILEILFFWHYDFSLFVRFVLFVVCFGAIWVIAALSLLDRRIRARWPAAITAVLAAALAVSVFVNEHGRITAREGVILAEEVTARKGDEESYSPSFKTPLHEGTEFVLIDERDDWFHVQLMDGRTCWIPRSSAGLI